MRRIALLCLLLFSCYEADMGLKQTVVRPGGIVTQPNEYGEVPPGTLRVGNNIALRRPGVIEPREDFTTYSDFDRTDLKPYKVWPFGNENGYDLLLSVVQDNDDARYATMVFDHTNEFVVYDYNRRVAGVTGQPWGFQPGQTHMTVNRDRMILTNDFAPAVVETSNGANRQAGLPMPSAINVDCSPAGNVVLANNFVSYRALFKRKFADGYVVTGAVSSAFANYASIADSKPSLTVYALDRMMLQAGDLIEVYRTKQQTSVAALGDDHRLATVHEVTAGEAAANAATFSDACLEANLGAYLYTNQNQEGLGKSNYMPPPSIDAATHKGATFYISTAEWHKITLSIPNQLGLLSTAAEIAAGIGYHDFLGDTAVGIANITNVASIADLAIGQRIGDADFVAGTKITGFAGAGPYTVNVSTPSLGTTLAALRRTTDVIVINGVELAIQTIADLVLGAATYGLSGALDVVVMPDAPVDLSPAVPVNGVSFDIIAPISGTGPFTVKATNGSRYSPPIPDYSSVSPLSSDDNGRLNRLHFSKIGQPEAVPVLNYLFVGHGQLRRVYATTNALLVFATDGAYHVSGDGDDWAVNPFNPELFLKAPDALTSLDNEIYLIASEGLVKVSETNSTPVSLSGPLIGDDFDALMRRFRGVSEASRPMSLWGVQLAGDLIAGEVWVNFYDHINAVAAPTYGWVQTYIWNTTTSTFTTQSDEVPAALTFSRKLQSLVLMPRQVDARVSTAGEFPNAPAVSWMTPITLEFNPVMAEDVGELKQWIDVTLHMKSLSQILRVAPKFDGDSNDAGDWRWTVAANAKSFEIVVPLLQKHVYEKKCVFGVLADTTADSPPYWNLLGLSFRYRRASETLRQ